MDIATISASLSSIKIVSDWLKKINDSAPDTIDKEKVSEELRKASISLQLAQASMAQGLGYAICKCMFPPQICLSIGRPEGYEQSECLECHQVYGDKPPEVRISWL